MQTHTVDDMHAVLSIFPIAMSTTTTTSPAPVTGPSTVGSADRPTIPPSDPQPRFLSQADCRDLARRLTHYASGRGLTAVIIASTWRGSTRWARNLISLGSDTRTNHLSVGRDISGAHSGFVNFNDTSDVGLVAALRRAERLLQLEVQERERRPLEQELQEVATTPMLFSEATYQLNAVPQAAIVREAMRGATAAGMLSAGYLEVAAHSLAFLTSFGIERYYQCTTVQYSVTVRDPKGVGSGWAGVDHWDWGAIDAAKLSAIALDKCLKSRNPVAVEPGRYTTILEPQAVAALVQAMISTSRTFWRDGNESEEGFPFLKKKGSTDWSRPHKFRGFSKVGEKLMDERITISADPMDPELKFPPFGLTYDPISGNVFNMMQPPVYHAATWVKNGVLTELPYDLRYGEEVMGKSIGLQNSGAFQMSGGPTSVDEMISATARGILVTRFHDVNVLDPHSLLCRGFTRDGLWLIENGKISKAVKNMVMTESPLFVLNNVDALGVPQRVFNTSTTPDELWWWSSQDLVPIIVPSLKVKEFSFTALSDAV